ncbi:MAG: HTH domain-containing protein [Pirellulaceae bacterium]|nr:HTH domain-containing protein [Pirellulaceae bacterium]
MSLVTSSPSRRARDNSTSALSRHARAIRILTCLQSGPGFNAAELAKYLNVSRRTIYRDMNLIREAGISIHFDTKHDAYRLEREMQQYLLPDLDGEDLTNLILPAHLSLANAFPGYAQRVRGTMSKLLCHFPHSLRTRVNRIVNGCLFEAPPTIVDEEAAVRTLHQLLVGIGDRRRLRLTLIDDDGGELRKLFSPYRIEFELNEMRIVGRLQGERQPRTLQLSDIRGAELTEKSFVPPRGYRFADEQSL